jgi:hypothetical protein
MPLADWATVEMLMVKEVAGSKAESGVKVTVESLRQAKLPGREGSLVTAASTEACCMGWLK